MAEATWTVSKDEWRTAFNGLRMQAKAHGVDPNEPNMAALILHEADFISNLFAENRFLQNILHGEDFNNV